MENCSLPNGIVVESQTNSALLKLLEEGRNSMVKFSKVNSCIIGASLQELFLCCVAILPHVGDVEYRLQHGKVASVVFERSNYIYLYRA